VAVKLGQTCLHEVMPIGWRPAAATVAAEAVVAEPDEVHREAVAEEVDAGGRTWDGARQLCGRRRWLIGLDTASVNR
jgi:hypothetical protein